MLVRRTPAVRWTLACVKPFMFLGLEVGEVVALDLADPVPLQIIGLNERPLVTNFGAVCEALGQGALLPLTVRESVQLLAHQRPHLSLVA